MDIHVYNNQNNKKKKKKKRLTCASNKSDKEEEDRAEKQEERQKRTIISQPCFSLAFVHTINWKKYLIKSDYPKLLDEKAQQTSLSLSLHARTLQEVCNQPVTRTRISSSRHLARFDSLVFKNPLYRSLD